MFYVTFVIYQGDKITICLSIKYGTKCRCGQRIILPMLQQRRVSFLTYEAASDRQEKHKYLANENFFTPSNLTDMKKFSYKLVFNRKKNLNKENKALIQIEIYKSGMRKYMSTHIYITDNQWNDKRRMVCKHPNADALNFYLYNSICRLETAELTLWRHHEDVTIENIIRLAKEKKSRPLLFMDFCREHIQYSNIRESTRKNRTSTLKLLRLFSPQLSFAGINESWLHAFEDYLLRVRGLKCNTVAKHLNHIKICINAAEKENIWHYDNPPFRNFHIRKQAVARTFLSENELQLLESWSDTHTGRAGRLLDAFLFCCYSGLRFSDFRLLTPDNIESGNGMQWIVLHTQKTSAEVRLPLHVLFRGKCLDLLKKHDRQLDAFFRIGDNSNINKLIKQICKQVGIHKQVSFHTARHTFATLLLQQGVNISTVQKLLGHKQIKTTQIYGAVTDRTVVEDLLSARYRK